MSRWVVAILLSVIASTAIAASPALTSIDSRKTHGSAGVFNLPLSPVLTSPSIEPRTGPNHTIVFTFDRAVTTGTATVIEGVATLGSVQFAGPEVVVNLTGVTNQQYVSVSISGVQGSDGSTGGAAAVRVGLLLGDVSQNATVTVADLGLTNAQIAQIVTSANYLKDVNASGTLSVADKAVVNTTIAKAIAPPATSSARKDAARFLRQATFGATRSQIDQLVTQGYAAWLDRQFAAPSVSHLATVQADAKLVNSPWAVTMPSIWKQYFEGEDQLRQRVSFALSQIFVVSLNNNTVGDAPCGPAAYLDILNRNAFGNARTLLRDVTLNPVMGEYLSMKESAKSDPVLQTQPDENYAREVLQLFSIGTVMLNLDGTVQLDGNGQPIPTYDEDVVKGFAKAISGWTYAGQDQTKPWRWLYPDIWHSDPVVRTQKACTAWTAPMEPWTASYRSADDTRTIAGPAHDTGSKQLLAYPGAPYSVLPPNQTPQLDLENVIDNVFNHPNVGPFLSRQLIQRLVTSNPTTSYVARVAAAFNNNGSGVRGDLKAVVRAILLDTEARNLAVAALPFYGKLTEPVIRFVQLHRAFDARRADGYYDLWDFSAPTALNQNPLRAPSVFNFFHPDFTPAGPLAEADLLGPEFEITNASSVAGFADFSKWAIIGGFDRSSSDTGNRMLPDYSNYLGLTNSPLQLLDELDMVLCAGGMDPRFKVQVAESVARVTGGTTAALSLERLNMALWLIINSPDYSVQK
jgi:uncharacterized protein (DUF1800 family)